ncbi:MAG TPA: nucleotidyltransferase domain-containing protein [Candidatus Rubneribacter avistercoris]|nr:nucleotidyltransferase domain-containing protein [Candidatus Rubneribacter avistercoris]
MLQIVPWWYTLVMQLTAQDIAKIVERVLVDYDVEKAYLFGSFARGESDESSDVDLRLVCGSSMTFGLLHDMVERLEVELGRRVEIVTNPPERMRPAFRKRIEKDEVLLYEAA